MAVIETKGKYNIALNGTGMMLAGQPERPAYIVNQAPAYGQRFAQGDRSYNDLSRWWYFAQTDWQGGITDFTSWEDTATFYYSTNVDVQTQPGTMLLEQLTTTASITNTTAAKRILFAKHVIFSATTERLVYIDVDDIRIATDDSLVYSNSKVGEPANFELFGDELWIGHSSTGSTSSMFVGHTLASAFTDITSYVDSVVAGTVRKFGPMKVNSGTMYVPVISTNAFVIAKSTVEVPASGADFSALLTIETIRSTAEIIGFEILGGSFICGIEDSNVYTIYEINIATGAYSVLYQTEGDSMSKDDVVGGRFITKLPGRVIITIPDSNGIGGRIYSYDGGTFEKIFSMSTTDRKYNLNTNESQADLSYGGVSFNDKVYWGNLVYDGSSFYNFIKNNDADTTDETDMFIPVGVDASEQRLMMVDVNNGSDNFNAYRYILDPSSYKPEGYIVFTNFDTISGIDKLAYSVTINFDSLDTGTSIEVQYTTGELDSSTTWTSLGTASNSADGGTITSKKFLFGDAITFKKIWFKVKLATSTASNTPYLHDLVMEYLPIPNNTKQWQISVNCSNELDLLDGSSLKMTGREVRALIERAWITKSLLDYQDIDFGQTLLNDAAFSAVATTVTVDDTSNFPEQGRLKVENEEILYTGKTARTFTGCTRGARGTTAVAHADNTPVYTGYYKVLVTDYDARVPVMQKDKEIESTVTVTLREASVA